MGTLKIFVFLITIVPILCKPIIVENENVITTTTEDVLITTSEESSEVINLSETLRNEVTNRMVRNQIRPGMVVTSYSVELEADVNGGSFSGRVVAQVSITDAGTREDPIMFYVSDLNVHSVAFSLLGGSTVNPADFFVNGDDGILEIQTGIPATLYTFFIEYTGSLKMAGKGFYVGHYGDNTYLAMNLHPTYARRVFPCMDEPTEVSVISFTFNNVEYTHLVANSMLEENSASQFRALQGPPHVWGMMAHNFININIPTANVLLYGRAGIMNQDAQASVAINFYFNNLNEWTNKPYFEILLNQDGRMNILALPDVSRDWHALSTVGIWEPYVFMETVHSIKQRKTGLVKIAEAMAKQWFGYVIFPENWRYEWVVSGLATYAAYEMLRQFQSDPLGIDVTLLDVDSLFVTDVIQESLLRDSYINAQVLEPENDLFDENEIRDHISGLLKYKAPALLRMLRLILGGPDKDFIQSAARALLTGRALQTVNSLNFVDALNSDWLFNGNNAIGDIAGFLEPWITNNGYPLISVGKRQGGLLISQERFGLSNQPHVNFLVPITYTTSSNPDFTDVHPIFMSDSTFSMNIALDEGDFVIFNIQGQGYYRVNYDNELWDAIIEALGDPERREQIHPLNRATLVDDALNLARAGRLDYDFALRLVLTMELETDYAVWKAFVRNMDFLRKRLVARVAEVEDLDSDIYMRMVRRIIGAIENELGFYPDISLSEPAMTTLTRGLVMEHACKANYQPCIAAAVDWFYDPNSNEPVVNPNIPHEIRPAVYCTMVREGDDQAISALYDRLEIEASHYERVVILESLACSQDENFIRTLLGETLASNGPYGVEERVKIFKAVAESSFQNAAIAMDIMSRRTSEIRDMYGGPEKLEELIFVISENMVDAGLSTDFRIWVQAQVNNLEDSQMVADRALAHVNENLEWNGANLDYVYEWIDLNHAPTLALSITALCASIMVALMIQ